jgi:hypothetical protein
MNIKTKVFGAAIVAALTFAPHVEATEILNTTLSGWESTLTGSPTEWDFNIPNSTYNTSAGYNMNVGTYGPINLTGPDGSGYNLSKNTGYGPNGNWTTLQGSSDGVGSLVFTTPSAGLTAVLFGFGITGAAAPVTVTLSDGEVFTASPSVNGNVLLGLSSATAITSFVVTTSSGSTVQLTDFFAGTSNEPADTPTAPAAEVTTALMIGSGLLFFGARRRVFSNFSRPQTQMN